MSACLLKVRARLCEVTKDCHPNMHKPDEQGVSAVVSGYHLDNAMPADPVNSCGEFIVGIARDGSQSYQCFNLADLIALARVAELGSAPASNREDG